MCPRPFLMRFFALPLQLIEPVQPADPFFPEHSPEEGSLPSRQLVYQVGGDEGMLRLDPDAGSGGERRQVVDAVQGGDADLVDGVFIF